MKPIILLLITLFAVYGQYTGIRFQDIKEFTFRKDVWTSNVKQPSTLQLLFVGGNARRNISQVKTVKCVNNNNKWNCIPYNLNPVLNFSAMSINCEDVEYNEEYVYPNSCYLEYTLNYMPDVKLEKQTNLKQYSNQTDFETYPDNQYGQLLKRVFAFMFCVILSVIFNACCLRPRGRFVVDNAEDAKFLGIS